MSDLKWNGKLIKELTDLELTTASKSLSDMHEFRESKKNDPRFEKRFKDQKLPEPNPLFVLMSAEIKYEIA